MDYPINITTIHWEQSILCFKGLLVKTSLKCCVSVHEDCYCILTTPAAALCSIPSGYSLFAKVSVNIMHILGIYSTHLKVSRDICGILT